MENQLTFLGDAHNAAHCTQQCINMIDTSALNIFYNVRKIIISQNAMHQLISIQLTRP